MAAVNLYKINVEAVICFPERTKAITQKDLYGGELFILTLPQNYKDSLQTYVQKRCFIYLVQQLSLLKHADSLIYLG